MKNRVQLILSEILLFVYSIFVFRFISIPISMCIEKSFETLFYLRIRYIVFTLILVAVGICTIVAGLKVIKNKFGEIGILSIYSIINIAFGTIYILSMFTYSVNFLEFMMTSLTIAIIVVVAPIIYILTAIIYFFVAYFKKKNK